MQSAIGSRSRDTLVSARRRVIVAVAVALMAVASATSPGAADEGSSESGDPYADDHRAFAAYAGISEAEAREYESLTDAVRDLANRARREHPSTFAGVYRDPSDPDSVVVMFTKNAQGSMESVSTDFPQPDLLKSQVAQYTLGQLESVQEQMVAISETLQEQGVEFVTIGIDVPSNRVAVEVSEPTLAQRELIEAVAEAVTVRDAPALELTVCSSRQACAPELRGGIEITNTAFRCSSGFEATRAGQSVLVTAGHCFRQGGNTVLHSGVIIGNVSGRAYNHLGDNDALWMTQGSGIASYWQPSNWIYATNTTTEYSITRVNGKFTETVGDPVCRTGITTARVCGKVTAVNVLVYVQETDSVWRIAGQNKADMCALPGDSGGPVYYAGRGYGLTSTSRFTTDGQGQFACYPVGNSNRVMTYPPLAEVQSDLGVKVRTSAP
jgi:hypothetical protein